MLEGFLVGIIDASLLRKAMQSCSGVDTYADERRYVPKPSLAFLPRLVETEKPVGV